MFLCCLFKLFLFLFCYKL